MKRHDTIDGIGPAIPVLAMDYLSGSTRSYPPSNLDDHRPRLRVGARGLAVEDLQDQLNELGERLPVDGVFGPATHASVVRFQLANGLEPDGVVDDATWHVLDVVTRRVPIDVSLDKLRTLR